MPAITLSELRDQYQEKSLTPTILIETLWPKLERADPAMDPSNIEGIPPRTGG